MKQKRVVVTSFILIIVGLFFILNFEGNITGATIGISNAIDPSSNLIFGFFLIWIAGIMLVGGSDISLEERVKKEHNKKDSEELKVNDLVAIRVTKKDYLNNQGNIFYASPGRPTIHFTLNHMVIPVNAGIANWKDANVAIISPLKDLIKNNNSNFYGGYTKDVFCVGYARLPNCVIVKRKGENDKQFREKINKKIKGMGFELFPERHDDFHEKQFKDFLGRLKKKGVGTYFNLSHDESIFDEVETRMGNLLKDEIRTYKKGKQIEAFDPHKEIAKYSCRRYMLETVEKLGLYDTIKTKKNGTLIFPTIDEFYKKVKENLGNKKFGRYESWVEKNLLGKDKLNIGSGKNVNFDFYRTMFRDTLESEIEWFEKETEEKLDKELKKDVNYVKSVDDGRIRRSNYVEIENCEKKLEELKNCITRFSGPINAWRAHWREKEKEAPQDYKN